MTDEANVTFEGKCPICMRRTKPSQNLGKMKREVLIERQLIVIINTNEAMSILEDIMFVYSNPLFG
jgi:hypothetical protein